MLDVHFYCTDYAGEKSKALRKRYLQEHLNYIAANMAQVSVAGPMLDAADEHIVGSCAIYRAATVAEARELFEQDPYFKAGEIWATVEMRVFRTVAGSWLGGKRW